jgi:hypothetical protein
MKWPPRVVEVWLAIVLAFSALFLAIFVEVGVVMLRLSGQHVVAQGDIIMMPSLYDTIQAMQDVQSISQFAVETVIGLVVVLVMTLGASFILLSMALWPPLTRDRIWGNLLGYALVALVGVFGTTVPGAPPRRSYNTVLLWAVPDSTTAPIHLTAAALFLFLPSLATIAWFVRHRKKPVWPRWRWWLALYALQLVIAAGYGIANLTVDSNTTLSAGAWLLLELTAFGSSFAVYALFELVRLNEALGAAGGTGYSRL